MQRPCVRVDRHVGERTRKELEAAGHREFDAAIDSDEEYVYIPVVDPAALPEEYEVVQRDVQPREDHTMPEDLLEFTPTYERLGDLVLLQEPDPTRAQAAAEAFMNSDLPVTAVLNQVSEVAGVHRVADWELIAGDHTETTHREYGAELVVDPTKAYFSPRLATERNRVINQIEPGEQVIDMFAGVGPYAIRAAMAGAEVVAVDINPEAAQYCRENAERNDVSEQVTVIEGDIEEIVDSYRDWADRLIMNLPHTAADYLDTASELAGTSCRVHYYDIRPEVEAFDGEEAVRAAFESRYHVEVINRQTVRSYAPGVVNVCLDIDVDSR